MCRRNFSHAFKYIDCWTASVHDQIKTLFIFCARRKLNYQTKSSSAFLVPFLLPQPKPLLHFSLIKRLPFSILLNLISVFLYLKYQRTNRAKKGFTKVWIHLFLFATFFLNILMETVPQIFFSGLPRKPLWITPSFPFYSSVHYQNYYLYGR